MIPFFIGEKTSETRDEAARRRVRSVQSTPAIALKNKLFGPLVQYESPSKVVKYRVQQSSLDLDPGPTVITSLADIHAYLVLRKVSAGKEPLGKHLAPSKSIRPFSRKVGPIPTDDQHPRKTTWRTRKIQHGYDNATCRQNPVLRNPEQ